MKKKISLDVTEEQLKHLEANRKKFGVSYALQIRIAIQEKIDKKKGN